MKDAAPSLNFLSHLGFGVEKDDLTVLLSAEKYPLIFLAMRLLARNASRGGLISGQSLFAFSMGLFDGSSDYLIRRIEDEMELEPSFFEPYFEQLRQKGYVYSHKYDWGPEGPVFFISFTNGVSGISLNYDVRKIHQLYFALTLQIGVKAICEDFDKQEASIKEFLLNRLMDCNNCMGCTKGGKSKKFTVPVEYNGTRRPLCPNSIWIGHQVEFMNSRIMNAMIDFSALQAEYGVNWRKK